MTAELAEKTASASLPQVGGSLKARLDRAIAAIAALKVFENGGLLEKEQIAALKNYPGFGGLPQIFDSKAAEAAGISNQAHQLEKLVSESEWKAIRQSTPNAHYTDPNVGKALWEIISKLIEKENGEPLRILEPGCGAGWLIAAKPAALNARVVGVEAEPLAARIAAAAYPQHEIVAGKFEEARLPDGWFDGVVANVPFGNYRIYEPRYRGKDLSVHDHFIVKALDKLRPGGVAAILTSRYTLDGQSSGSRQEMQDKAALLGTVRLPEEVFGKSANTAVVADLLIFQKRPRPLSKETEDERASIVAAERKWINVRPWPAIDGPAATGQKVAVNELFLDQPELIIGELGFRSGAHGGEELTVRRPPSWPRSDLAERVGAAMSNRASGFQPIFKQRPASKQAPIATGRIEGRAKEGSFVLDDAGRVKVAAGGFMASPEPPLTIREEAMMAMAIKTRDAVKAVLETQLKNGTSADRRAAREELNRVYDAFVGAYGRLRDRGNWRVLQRDPEGSLLVAIEAMDGSQVGKGEIFTRDVITEPEIPTRAADLSTAVGLSFNKSGSLDVAYIANLLGVKPKTVEQRLLKEGFAFKDPSTGGLVEAGAYLSGDVVDKLETARAAQKLDPAFTSNVEALHAAQPKPLRLADIHFGIGAPWLPRETVTQFIAASLKLEPADLRLSYDKGHHKWMVEGATKAGVKRLRLRGGIGTSRLRQGDFLEAVLNRRTPALHDQGGRPDVVAIGAVQNQAKDYDRRFRLYVAGNASRREAVEGRYNSTINRFVARKWDGSHQSFPGLSNKWRGLLRNVQKDAVWRALNGNTLFAHEVGWGKSPEFILSGIEAKRLGFSAKPMLAVHKPTLESFRELVADMYPGKQVLVYPPGDVDADTRKEFFSRVAVGNWDLVIVTHDALDLLPMAPETEARYLQRELAFYREARIAAKTANGRESKTREVKQLELSIKKIEARIAELTGSPRKDNAVTWDDLGVDWLGVDEFHKYKNLHVATSMQRVKGLPSGESQRAANMYWRALELADRHGKEWGFVTGTGTPMTNSVVEGYTLQRYHQPMTMEAAGISAFDAWAATFAQPAERIEADVTGRLVKTTRLSEFVNTPELRKMIGAFMDVGFTEDVPGIDKPKVHSQAVAIEAQEYTKAINSHLADRAANLNNAIGTESRDNMLLVATHGRLAALDPRLIDAGIIVDDNGSKVARTAELMATIREANPGSVQAGFFDLGVHPQEPGGPGDTMLARLRRGLRSAGLANGDHNTGFTVRQALKDELVSRGVPPTEIEDFFELNPKEREAAKKRLNDGQSSIAIGSSDRLGTGNNIQKRLIATHDVDVPMVPALLEQRRGRMDRHGNQYKTVGQYRYPAVGTADVYLWQLNDTKSGFIRTFVRGNSLPRRVLEEDSSDVSPAQLMAIAHGDPLIIYRANLRSEIEEEAFRADLAASDRNSCRARLLEIQQAIVELSNKLEAAVARASLIQPALNDRAVLVTSKGEELQGRDEVGKWLKDNFPQNSWYGRFDWPAGQWRGFNISFMKEYGAEPYLALTVNGVSERVDLGNLTESGVQNGLDAALRRLARSSDADGALREIEAERSALEERLAAADDDKAAALKLEAKRHELQQLERGLMLPAPSADEMQESMTKWRTYAAAQKAFVQAVGAFEAVRSMENEKAAGRAYAVMVARHPLVQAVAIGSEQEITIPFKGRMAPLSEVQKRLAADKDAGDLPVSAAAASLEIGSGQRLSLADHGAHLEVYDKDDRYIGAGESLADEYLASKAMKRFNLQSLGAAMDKNSEAVNAPASGQERMEETGESQGWRKEGDGFILEAEDGVYRIAHEAGRLVLRLDLFPVAESHDVGPRGVEMLQRAVLDAVMNGRAASMRFSFAEARPIDPVGLLWRDPVRVLDQVRAEARHLASMADLEAKLRQINAAPENFGELMPMAVGEAAELAKAAVRREAANAYREGVQARLTGQVPRMPGPPAPANDMWSVARQDPVGGRLPPASAGMDIFAGSGATVGSMPAAAAVPGAWRGQDGQGTDGEASFAGAGAAEGMPIAVRPLEARRAGRQDHNGMDGGVDKPWRIYSAGTITRRFSDIGGAATAVEGLQDFVDYIRAPDKYRQVGARLPSGAILEGEPGTGKTLLAEALAGETNANFFVLSGSDLLQKYVGEGGKVIRELYEEARSRAPSIVFIDELDSVGQRSDNSPGSREVINQLLVETAGFDKASGKDGVVTLAATNHIGLVDPALLRAGRLTRRIHLSRPGLADREQILRLHARGKPIDAAVDFKALAAKTAGATGSGLEELVNDAALNSARRSSAVITGKDFAAAFEAVGKRLGSQAPIPLHARPTYAAHLAGHLVAGSSLGWSRKEAGVGIEAGASLVSDLFNLPQQPMTREDLGNALTVLLAGRKAEAIVLGSQGVSELGKEDISNAIRIAEEMVSALGFGSGDLKMAGRKSPALLSEKGKRTAEAEIAELVRHADSRAGKLLAGNRDLLERLAARIRKGEKIGKIRLVSQDDAAPTKPGVSTKRFSAIEVNPLEAEPSAEVLRYTLDRSDGTCGALIRLQDGSRQARAGFEDHEELIANLRDAFGARLRYALGKDEIGDRVYVAELEFFDPAQQRPLILVSTLYPDKEEAFSQLESFADRLEGIHRSNGRILSKGIGDSGSDGAGKEIDDQQMMYLGVRLKELHVNPDEYRRAMIERVYGPESWQSTFAGLNTRLASSRTIGYRASSVGQVLSRYQGIGLDGEGERIADILDLSELPKPVTKRYSAASIDGDTIVGFVLEIVDRRGDKVGIEAGPLIGADRYIASVAAEVAREGLATLKDQSNVAVRIRPLLLTAKEYKNAMTLQSEGISWHEAVSGAAERYAQSKPIEALPIRGSREEALALVGSITIPDRIFGSETRFIPSSSRESPTVIGRRRRHSVAAAPAIDDVSTISAARGRDFVARGELGDGTRVYFEVPADRRARAAELGGLVDQRNRAFYAQRGSAAEENLASQFSEYHPEGRRYIEVKPSDTLKAVLAGAGYDEIAGAYFIPEKAGPDDAAFLLRNFSLTAAADRRDSYPISTQLRAVEEQSRKFIARFEDAGVVADKWAELPAGKAVTQKPVAIAPAAVAHRDGGRAQDSRPEAISGTKASVAAQHQQYALAIMVPADQAAAIGESLRGISPAEFKQTYADTRALFEKSRQAGNGNDLRQASEELERALRLLKSVAFQRGISLEAKPSQERQVRQRNERPGRS